MDARASREIAQLRPHLRTALVADALDAIGRRSQCLGPGIVPLQSNVAIVGRAFTVTAIPADRPAHPPYVGLLKALDEIGTEEVFIYPTSRSDRAAVWGELISAACVARGVVGVVTDGLVRDAMRIRQLDFPGFCRGHLPYDVNGRLEVVDHGQIVEIDGVRIAPGDLVIADDDGVVIVPADVEEEVIERSLGKDALEKQFRDAVEHGDTAQRAFERFDVL